MSFVRACLSIVFFGVVSVLGASLPAQSVPGEKEFAAGFKSVRSQMASGRFKEARAALTRLLAEHEDRNYARDRIPEILEEWKRCAFRVQNPPPDPKKLLKSELLAWDPQSGKIKLKMRFPDAHDFEKGERSYYFPAKFVGPHSIELKGAAYPRHESLWVTVCSEDKRAFQATFGLPAGAVGIGESYWPASLRMLIGEDDEKKLDFKETSPMKPDQPFTVRVDVGTTSVKVSASGQTFLNGQKRADAWGYLYVKKMTELFKEATIEGRIEPGWIQGMVDRESQAALEKFERTYDPAKDAPAWLFMKLETATAAKDKEDALCPGNPGAAEFAAAKKILDAAWGRNVDGAKRLLEKAAPDAFSAATREYLISEIAWASGDWEEARKRADRSRALAPDFWRTQYVAGICAAYLGDPATALACFKVVIGIDPGDYDNYKSFARFLLRSGALAEARSVVEAAQKNGFGTRPEIVGALEDLVRIERGPDWSRVFEYKSTHFHVLSDIDKEMCRRASDLLEEAYTIYTARLKDVDVAGKPFKVFLFSGEAGYVKYMGDPGEGFLPKSAGVYSSATKQLLIWDGGDRTEMMNTVRHEGFHQYLDRVAKDPPIWFNEGSAVYFEYSASIGGVWKAGQIDAHYLERAKEAVKTPGFTLASFLLRDDKQFYRNADRNYPTAWAFVHFLRESKPERKRDYERLFELLTKGKRGEQSVTTVFPLETMDALQREFVDYVSALKAP